MGGRRAKFKLTGELSCIMSERNCMQQRSAPHKSCGPCHRCNKASHLVSFAACVARSQLRDTVKQADKKFQTNVALIQDNGPTCRTIVKRNAMKISDCVCPSCGSSYLVAESTSAPAGPSHADCVICGERLASWEEPRMRVYRLEMSPELKYPRIEPPPSPQ